MLEGGSGVKSETEVTRAQSEAKVTAAQWCVALHRVCALAYRVRNDSKTTRRPGRPPEPRSTGLGCQVLP